MTIMEVLIAMAISAVVLTGIAALIIGSVRINNITNDRREAAELAEKKIEELRRIGFSALASGADTVGSYTREWVVSEISGKPRIKYIEVTIRWNDSKDREHVVVFNTTIYRNAYPYKS